MQGPANFAASLLSFESVPSISALLETAVAATRRALPRVTAMPKNKSHKGLLKRIRISKTGKVRHRSANHKHLRSGKGGKRLRSLRKDPYMTTADVKRLEKMLSRRLRGRDQARTALRRSPAPGEKKAAAAAASTAASAAAATKPAPTKTAKAPAKK